MKKTTRLITAILSLGLMVFYAGSLVALAATVAITLSVVTGPPNTSVTVTANNTGFTPGETVTIAYDNITQLATATANGTGGLSGTAITIPASPSGAHTITATGSVNSGSATFTVTPVISTNIATSTVGASVTISGSGFSGNETGIRVTFDGTQVTTTPASITSNPQGSWTATFVIPAAASGAPRPVDSFGAITQATSVPDLSFTVTPTISLNRANGAPGASVTITGNGFASSETGIAVTYDGNPVTLTPAAPSVSPQGRWTATFIVPTSPSGAHIVDASGSSTAAANVPDATFTTSASISVRPATAASGASITVTGSGFGAGETGIAVTFDTKQVASSITADSQGGWTATFTVPPSPGGNRIIDASGSSTTAATIQDQTLVVTAGITLSRPNAVPGTSVTVTGASFGASETGITVSYDGAAVASGITADASGGWKANLVIPTSPAGAHTIDANGAVTQSTTVPDQSITVIAGISTNQPNAAPGSSVTINGVGFGASETGISVTYDDKAVASGISANAQGGWTATFTVPASTSGTHSIKAQGSSTPLLSMSESGFSVGSGVIVNPTSGSVGATVDISGSGFAPNSPLKFAYDNKEIAGDGVTTDANGSFTKTITIPQSKAGNHTIKITDSQNHESTTIFTMENELPPTPVLVSPKDGAREGIGSDIKPTLRWSSVTDDSGVVYNLQVATDPDFAQVILEKTAIAGTRYTLTSAEALARGDYYWRVRAVDGASNEGAWSPGWHLKSGLMPLSTLITIIVLAIAAVAGLSYYFLVVRRVKRIEGIPVPEAAPAQPAPGVVPGQWRLIEPPGATSEGNLPWRLALPQPEKGAKTLSTEEMARLKVIMDFAQSLPLAEPGYNAKWLLDLAEHGTGPEPSVETYRQILEGQIQIRYEPGWMRHPIYQDLAVLLEGQPILQDLNAFVDAVNRCSAEVSAVLQQIYGDAAAEVQQDLVAKGGWNYVAAVYADAVRWFLGKSLREPAERDYTIKPGGAGDEPGSVYLWGEEAISPGEPLIRVTDDNEARQLRQLHVKLRQSYRNERVKQLVDMMTQMAVQRDRLTSAFSQFNNFMR